MRHAFGLLVRRSAYFAVRRLAYFAVYRSAYFAVRRLAYPAVRRPAYPAVRRSKPAVFRSRASPYHSVKQKKDLQAVLFLSYKVALLIAIAYILSNFMMNWKMILDFIFYCCSVGDDFGGALHDG